MHPHREVVPLNVRRRYMVRVGSAPNRGTDNVRNDHRRILGVGALERDATVNLDLVAMVGARKERFDRLVIDAEAVGRDLYGFRAYALGQVTNKTPGILLVTLP